MCLSKNWSLPTPATTVKTIPKGDIFLNNPFQLVYQTLQHGEGEGLGLPHGDLNITSLPVDKWRLTIVLIREAHYQGWVRLFQCCQWFNTDYMMIFVISNYFWITSKPTLMLLHLILSNKMNIATKNSSSIHIYIMFSFRHRKKILNANTI